MREWCIPHLTVVPLSRKIAAALENARAKLQTMAAIAASELMCARGRLIPIASSMTEHIIHTDAITRCAPNAGRYLMNHQGRQNGVRGGSDQTVGHRTTLLASRRHGHVGANAWQEPRP